MHKPIALFLLLLIGISVSAQTQSFSLENAKAYALEHHLEIINAHRNIDIAKQQIVETRGMGLPQVDINGQFNHYVNLPVTVVDAQLFNPFAPEGETMEFRMGQEFSANGSLSVNQLLFNGSYIVGLQASKHYKQLQESAFLKSEEDVIFNVIQAYQLAVIAKENLAFSDSMVQITQQLIDKQQNYFEVGMIVQEDMDQLNYSLQTAKNAAVNANIQYSNAMSILKYSMGIPMTQDIDVSESSSDLMNRSNISGGDIHNNLQFMLQQQNITLQTLNLKNNKFSNLPSLYAFLSHSYNAYRDQFNFFADEKWFPQTVWGLQLNVPVFSGLQRHARTQQTKIKLLQEQSNLELLEQGLQLQEVQLQNNLMGAKAKYELQKENIRLAKSIYNNAVEVEQIGKGNSLTVTQKHNQVIVAEAQYLGSMIELFQAQLELDKLYNELLKNQ